MKLQQLKKCFKEYGKDFSLLILELEDLLESQEIGRISLTCYLDSNQQLIFNNDYWANVESYYDFSERELNLLKFLFEYVYSFYEGNFDLANIWIFLKKDYTLDNFLISIQYGEIHYKDRIINI